MPIAFIFWLLMLLWLLFGLWVFWPLGQSLLPVGNLLQFLVIGLLGWQVFGNPVR
jgi:hypothetical protein